MTETLFAFNKLNYLDCQNAFRGPGNQEYYLGDYSIEAGSVIDVRAEKKAVSACSIIRLRSKTRLLFRRSWAHIRQDGTDVAVLWFVKRGRMCISHQSGYTVAEPGDFVITKSTTPFAVECQTDEQSVHEVFHVIVPMHVLRSFIPQEIHTGFSVRAESRKFVIAEHILTDIFEDDGELEGSIADLLVNCALSVLGHAIQGLDLGTPVRQSLSEKRLQDVLRFIDIHLCNSNLNVMTVAMGCGISSRYLTYLLKHNGTPFSKLVWQKRLQIASRWLATSRPNNVSVREIAYKTGFKNAAHFSRMFKRVFNVNPSEYRSVDVQQAMQDRDDLFADGTGSLQ